MLLHSAGQFEWSVTRSWTWGEAIRRGIWGQILKSRYRSALVAALACASALAITLAAETAAARGAKGVHATAKAAGKTTKATGKKVAGKKVAGKSKGSKSAE